MGLKDRQYARYLLFKSNSFSYLAFSLILVAYLAISGADPHNILSYGAYFSVLLVILSTFGNLRTLFSEDFNLFMALPVSARCVVGTWVLKSGTEGGICLIMTLAVNCLRWGIEEEAFILGAEVLLYMMLLIEGIFLAYAVSCGSKGSQSERPRNIVPVVAAVVIILAGVLMSIGKTSIVMTIVLVLLDICMHPYNIWYMKKKLAL